MCSECGIELLMRYDSDARCFYLWCVECLRIRQPS